jgi:Glycerophosphoryl diester phosphodiesterase family
MTLSTRSGRPIALLLGVGIAFACSSLPTRAVGFAEPTPLTRAHAHNDYEHKRPLFDALEQGLCSVEADIFLVDGQLLVGHTRRSLKPERTLESLYLVPLEKRVEKNGGRVYRDGPDFTLLIDIKTNGETTYSALKTVLEKYADVINSPGAGAAPGRAINVVATGNRPADKIAADPSRLVGIDGVWSDLDSNQPANLIPQISENWRSHFKWRGKGTIPSQEREKIRMAVQKSHAHGRRLRFWGAPDNPAVWQELYDDNVDLINTDDLPGIAQFLNDPARRSTNTR